MSKCVICGKELTIDDGIVYCKSCIVPKPVNQLLQGWICPRCKIVNSPYKMKCDCNGLTSANTTLKP